jgi:hypothetical protein
VPVAPIKRYDETFRQHAVDPPPRPCDYVYLNPVRAKLLKPHQPLSAYRWSSWPEYLKSPSKRWLWWGWSAGLRDLKLALLQAAFHFSIAIMRRLLIATFTAGWVLPLWVSADTLFDHLRGEVLPRLHGQDPTNSFPFVHFSQQSFTVGCVWLAAVVFFWAWRLADFRRDKTHAT